MEINNRLGYHTGQPVDVYDGEYLFSGTISTLGTKFASIIDTDGVSYDVDYGCLQPYEKKGFNKTAQNKPIKEDEKDGKMFLLDRKEDNVDGTMTISYQVTVDGKQIWESEEIVTNVYDVEKGWSPPDDFDENKLDLIQNTAESGFDLLVESYQNIEESLQTVPTEDGEDKPSDVPAFAPGEEPSDTGDAGGFAGGGGGGDMGGGEMGDVVEEGGEGEEAVVETTEEATEEVPVETEASLSFSRKVANKDDRLHNNPEHRLNPLLRSEMEKKDIDSGKTHDIALSEKLKGYDYGGYPPKTSSIDRLSSKLKDLN